MKHIDPVTGKVTDPMRYLIKKDPPLSTPRDMRDQCPICEKEWDNGGCDDPIICGKQNRYNLWEQQVDRVCIEYDLSRKEMAKFFKLLTHGTKDGKSDLNSLLGWKEGPEFMEKFYKEN